jgi:hypothetical protein
LPAAIELPRGNPGGLAKEMKPQTKPGNGCG